MQLAVECGAPCLGQVDLSAVLKTTPLELKRTIKIPLLCLEEVGADFLNMDVPFSMSTDQPFAATFANIQLVAGAAKDADALRCADVGVDLKL